MAKDKLNKFNELLDVTDAQKAMGISIVNGRRCHHGLNMDQIDEMNDLSLGLEAYKKYIQDKGKAKVEDSEVVEEPEEDPKKKVKKVKE